MPIAIAWLEVSLKFLASSLTYIVLHILCLYFEDFIKTLGKIYSQVDGGIYALMMHPSNVPYCIFRALFVHFSLTLAISVRCAIFHNKPRPSGPVAKGDLTKIHHKAQPDRKRVV